MNEYRKQRLVEIARSLQDLRTGRAFHISFILKNNQILAFGVNDYNRVHPAHLFGKYVATKQNTPNSKYIAGYHSETAAIKQYIHKYGTIDCSGLTLFNIRLGFKGQTMMAKCCDNCEKNIVKPANFKHVIWTE